MEDKEPMESIKMLIRMDKDPNTGEAEHVELMSAERPTPKDLALISAAMIQEVAKAIDSPVNDVLVFVADRVFQAAEMAETQNEVNDDEVRDDDNHLLN